MNKTIFISGIFFGALAIILGAFGSHTLGEMLDSKALSTFETGVRYQMYHALFLLVLGSLNGISHRARMQVFYLVVLGVVFFSFSIYFLATNDLTAFDFKKIGVMTPIGGVLLIFSWLLLGYRVFRKLN